MAHWARAHPSPDGPLTLALTLTLALALALALSRAGTFAPALSLLALTSGRSRTEPLKPVSLLHAIPTRVTHTPWCLAAAALPLTGVRLGWCNLFGILAAWLFDTLLGLPLPASAKEIRSSSNQAGRTCTPHPSPSSPALSLSPNLVRVRVTVPVTVTATVSVRVRVIVRVN